MGGGNSWVGRGQTIAAGYGGDKNGDGDEGWLGLVVAMVCWDATGMMDVEMVEVMMVMVEIVLVVVAIIGRGTKGAGWFWAYPDLEKIYLYLYLYAYVYNPDFFTSKALPLLNSDIISSYGLLLQIKL